MNTSRSTSRMILFLALVASACIVAAFWIVPPLFILAGLVGIGAFVLIARRPLWGIYAMAFALPFERIGAIDVAGTTIRASHILAVLTIGGWIARGLIRRRLSIIRNPLLIPIGALVIVSLFGLLNTPNLSRSVAVLVFTAFTMLVALVVPQIVRSSGQMRTIIRIVLISAGLVGLFGLYQFIGDMIGLPSSLTGLRDLYTKDVFGFPRIQSTALEPLYFANYLLLPIALGVVLFIRRTSRINTLWLIALTGLLGLNLVLTVSRGGYLAIAGVLFMVVVFSVRQTLRNRVLLPAIIGTAVIGIIAVRFLGYGDTAGLNLETFTGHVENVFYGASFTERVETIELARDAWHAHPWVGNGPGSFGPLASVHPSVIPDDGWKIVNNEFVELLAETGILGTAAFLLILIILIVRSIKAIKRTNDPFGKAVMIALLATIIGTIIQYQTFSTLYVFHIWFVIGLTVAAQNVLLERKTA